MRPITRRQLLGAAAGATLLGSGLAMPSSALTINPRSTWGSAHPPTGPLTSEDVRFLIVHHSASRNGHTGDDVPAILRSWFNFHTGPDKGWNDVAYNFVIDSEGGIWEARQGSIAGPVAGDATGGNQGFTQLVCVIGDFNTAQPTQAALSSLVLLSAWLADRYGISTAPGAEVSFTSRGSNLWPAGVLVTTPTITGHRTMSKTTCPGNNFFPYVSGGLMADVHAARGGAPPPTGSTTTVATTTTTLATTTTEAITTTTVVPTTTIPLSTTTSIGATTTTPLATTTVPSNSTTAVLPATTAVTPTSTVPVAIAEPNVGAEGSGLLVGAAAAFVAAGAGLLWWRWKRMGG